MSLQELLFGSWTPPEKFTTRAHRIGLNSIYRYVPPKPRPVKVKQPPESEIKLLEIVKKLTQPMTPMEISKKTPWTRNHCGLLLCRLWKYGLLKRHKIIVQNSRTYLYSYKGD